jgi:hypothetical protein
LLFLLFLLVHQGAAFRRLSALGSPAPLLSSSRGRQEGEYDEARGQDGGCSLAKAKKFETLNYNIGAELLLS